MRLPALILALSLAGAAHAEPFYPGQDLAPHAGALRDFHKPVVVSFASQADVSARCDELTGYRRNLSCASAGSGFCMVHIVPPADHRDTMMFAMLYHELLHCALGHWHD